jgi:hypothetical protein
MNTQETFFVLAFLINETGETTLPYAVRRLSDNKIFQVGDHTADYSGRQGFIERIELDGPANEVRLCLNKTDEKGILLEDAVYYKSLPTLHITGDHTAFFGIPAQILGVHSYEGKTKLDLELSLPGGEKTRIYNADSKYVQLVKGEEKPMVLVMDNADRFREYLTARNIEWKPAGTGTLVPSSIDLFWLGSAYQSYKEINMPR